MSIMTDTLRDSILNTLELIDKNIEFASDELWEKNFGKDFYWNQVVHAIAGVSWAIGMLLGDKNAPELPEGITGDLEQPADPSVPHSKEIVLEYNNKMKKFVAEHFKTVTDEDLVKPIDFFGEPNTHAGIYVIAATHTLYHVGACDIALREHNLKAAM